MRDEILSASERIGDQRTVLWVSENLQSYTDIRRNDASGAIGSAVFRGDPRDEPKFLRAELQP
jgi:hypothetical protein